MGVNISGSGILSGIASLVMGAVNSFNLLVTRVIGYTNIPGTGGSSYYTTMTGSDGPGFVTVKSNGQTAYSIDGASWTLGTNLPEFWYYAKPAFGNGVFSLIGSRRPDGGSPTAYSTDGVNWTLGTRIFSIGFRGVSVFGNNVFAAINEAGQIAYSTDGINWTLGTVLSGFSGVSTLHFANNIFIAKDDSGQIARSIDAINWTLGTNLDGDYWRSNIIFELNKFVTNNESGQTAYSTDGLNWTLGSEVPVNPNGEGAEHGFNFEVFREDIVFGDGKFVMVSENGFGIFSYDGINWTAAPTFPAPLFSSIAFGNNKFASFSEGGSRSYSTDGLNWTQIPGPIDQNYSGWVNDAAGLIFANNIFIAKNNNGQIAYSEDAINWTLGDDLPGENWTGFIGPGIISTLVETQVSIGNQGEEGAEVLSPVDVYTVPANTTTDIDQVTVKNNSSNTITYDLAVLNAGVELTDQNALINDQAISAGATATVTTPAFENLTAGQRIVVFPSAVDVVEVKVFGTETSNGTSFTLGSTSSVFNIAPEGKIGLVLGGDLRYTVLAQNPSPENNGWLGKTISFSNLTSSFSQPGLDYINNQVSFTVDQSYNEGLMGTYIILNDTTSMGMGFSITGGSFTINI